jgi:hypothetical protein
VTPLRAERDARLAARIVSRTPLLYAAGADAALDRPRHVRAGSGLGHFGAELAVIQDDASFLALIAADTFHVRAVPFARGHAGKRLFDDTLGNKAHKLDLEACVSVTLRGKPALIAFGSGSTPARERVVVTSQQGSALTTRVLPLPGLYASLRRHPAFAGTALNLEGAVTSGERLLLVQRGNAAPQADAAPRDAIAELLWDDVLAGITEDPAREPRVQRVTAYELGERGGVRLTFTDACAVDGDALLYLAAAEASPDAVRDGPVAGCAVGILRAGSARYAPLQDAHGADVTDKAEGILLDRRRPQRALIVLDPDDPARPSELCEVALHGPWWD